MKKNKPSIELHKLNIHEYENAFIMPTQSNEFEEYFVGGVYNSKGQIINSSSIKSIPTWTDKSPELITEVEKLKTYKGKSIYLGSITLLYGHFFTDTATRLWHLLENQDYDRLVFVDPFLEIIRVNEKTSEILDLTLEVLNIPKEKILIVREVSEFENLSIPDKTYHGENDVHYKYSLIFDEIVAHCEEKHHGQLDQWNEKIYISNTDNNRSSFECINEADVIQEFKKLDYSILDPQKVSMSEQVAILAQSKTIACFTGANLYNILFAKNETTLVSVATIKFKGRSYGGIRAFNLLRNPTYYHIKYFGTTYSFDSCSLDIEYLETQLDFVKEAIRYVKLDNFSKTDYYKALDKLNELQPEVYNYFEIGTNTGNSLKIAKGNCIGVDPRFEIEQDIAQGKENLKLYQIPSDDFFENYQTKALNGNKVHFSFIDGLHHADQVFKDIINTEAIMLNDGIISVHDIIPIDNKSANRKRGPVIGAWTGDVWKAIYVLMEHRQDLKFIFLNCPPSGLLLIFNLDNQWLQSNQDEYLQMLQKADDMPDDKLVDYLKLIELVETDYFLEHFTLEGGYNSLTKKQALTLETLT